MKTRGTGAFSVSANSSARESPPARRTKAAPTSGTAARDRRRPAGCNNLQVAPRRQPTSTPDAKGATAGGHHVVASAASPATRVRRIGHLRDSQTPTAAKTATRAAAQAYTTSRRTRRSEPSSAAAISRRYWFVAASQKRPSVPPAPVSQPLLG